MGTLRGKSDDSPKITMRVEYGRLVPVSAFDLELVNQWRNGAIVSITPTRAMQRPLERRYFAMLTHLIRMADTPWSNVEAAHEALKLATGFVTPYKKKAGGWGAHPRSITTFTDAELNDFFELFCSIVRDRFGIDPETLQKESSDTGSSEQAAPYGVVLDDGPGAGPIPSGVGEPSPGVGHPAPDGPEAGNALDSTPRDTLSAEGPKLRPEEWDWLKTAARMLVAATEPGGDVGIVDQQVKTIKQFLTPHNISQEAKDLATLIYRHCRSVTRGAHPLDSEEIARVARCKVSDLRPEAR